MSPSRSKSANDAEPPQPATSGSSHSGCVCTVKPSGSGLYLKPSTTRIVQGDGLYLKRGRQFIDGSGLILGPNSPFKNIPLLGMFL